MQAEDFANQEAIAKLLRFASTYTDSSAQTVSLEDYVSRMKEGQEKLLHHCSSYAAAKSSHTLCNCCVRKASSSCFPTASMQ